MESSSKKPELIAIVGPTASGKSELALKIAKTYPAEIIAADSRTIYKGLDIGTAKPTSIDRKKVRHWGLDLIEPGEAYSTYSFQKYANDKIEVIKKKKKLPLLVGGTGLYVDSVLYDFKLTVPAGGERELLERKSLKQLQQIIINRKLMMPQNEKNKLHLIRTIERNGRIGRRVSIMPGAIIVGILPDDTTLQERIKKRSEAMFKAGLINETKQAIEHYGEQVVRKCGIVYKYTVDIVEGACTEQTATTEFQRSDWQYARRQRTWFKRNKDIVWFKDIDSAYSYISALLNK